MSKDRVTRAKEAHAAHRCAPKPPDLMKPNPALLMKLGSIIVHFDEGTELGGHEYDIQTARKLLADPEVDAWIKAMSKAAYLPLKRSAR